MDTPGRACPQEPLTAQTRLAARTAGGADGWWRGRLAARTAGGADGWRRGRLAAWTAGGVDGWRRGGVRAVARRRWRRKRGHPRPGAGPSGRGTGTGHAHRREPSRCAASAGAGTRDPCATPPVLGARSSCDGLVVGEAGPEEANGRDSRAGHDDTGPRGGTDATRGRGGRRDGSAVLPWDSGRDPPARHCGIGRVEPAGRAACRPCCGGLGVRLTPAKTPPITSQTTALVQSMDGG
jgi:hypothetical protein